MKGLMSLLVVLSAVQVSANAEAAERTMAEGGAQTIVSDYNNYKTTVGIGYDLMATPALVCMGKVYLNWTEKYDGLIRPIEAEVANSVPIARMRSLAQKVDDDIVEVSNYVQGIQPLVAQAMQKHQIAAPDSMTLQDVRKQDYLAKLHACRSSEFFASIESIASEQGVDLEPQTLMNQRLLDVLNRMVERQ